MTYRRYVCLAVVFALGLAHAAWGGLVGYWKFDEGQGTVVRDHSGSGNDGTIKKLYLGVGSRTSSAPGGAGRIYVDDIRVIKP